METETPQEANKFLNKPDDFAAEIRKQGDASAREGVERVLEVLVSTNCTTYQDCVSWVRLHFQVRQAPAPLITVLAKDGTNPAFSTAQEDAIKCYELELRATTSGSHAWQGHRPDRTHFWRCCDADDARDSRVPSGVPRFSSTEHVAR